MRIPLEKNGLIGDTHLDVFQHQPIAGGLGWNQEGKEKTNKDFESFSASQLPSEDLHHTSWPGWDGTSPPLRHFLRFLVNSGGKVNRHSQVLRTLSGRSPQRKWGYGLSMQRSQTEAVGVTPPCALTVSGICWHNHNSIAPHHCFLGASHWGLFVEFLGWF